jgi:hypothetical protein
MRRGNFQKKILLFLRREETSTYPSTCREELSKGTFLHKLVIVFHGFDMVVCKEVE